MGTESEARKKTNERKIHILLHGDSEKKNENISLMHITQQIFLLGYKRYMWVFMKRLHTHNNKIRLRKLTKPEVQSLKFIQRFRLRCWSTILIQHIDPSALTITCYCLPQEHINMDLSFAVPLPYSNWGSKSNPEIFFLKKKRGRIHCNCKGCRIVFSNWPCTWRRYDK